MSYLDIKFQWYNAGIKSTKPQGDISLLQFINSVKTPKKSLLKAFKDISEAAHRGDKKLKDELKQQFLFFVTPSIRVKNYRRYNEIEEFLPFCVLEYDGIENSDVLRDYIFEKQPSCIFAFSSPSKTGCKFVFLIKKPISVEHYKELYYGIAHQLDKFVKLDLSNRNAVLPLFVSYDPDAKYREDAVESTLRGYCEGSYDANKAIDFDIPESVDEKVELEVVDKIEFLVGRIFENAHPQILGISFLVGGWAASNYIGQELAFDTLIAAVENNDYMSKNTEGYRLTAKTMFQKGLNHPAEYKK